MEGVFLGLADAVLLGLVEGIIFVVVEEPRLEPATMRLVVQGVEEVMAISGEPVTRAA